MDGNGLRFVYADEEGIEKKMFLSREVETWNRCKEAFLKGTLRKQGFLWKAEAEVPGLAEAVRGDGSPVIVIDVGGKASIRDEYDRKSDLCQVRVDKKFLLPMSADSVSRISCRVFNDGTATMVLKVSEKKWDTEQAFRTVQPWG
jgi:hypothetical protein